MNREYALRQYEDYLLTGKKFSFSGTKMDKQKDALEIVKYVVLEVMGWTPQVAMESFTWDVVKDLGLATIVENYISYPTDINIHEDTDYLIYMAFPGQVHYDVAQKVINVYKKILSGTRPRFPKNYFIGDNGAYKAGVLLMYAISRHAGSFPQDSVNLYRAFANTPAINVTLKEWHIADTFKNLYSNPLDFLHFSLPDDLVDDFLYASHMYENVRAEYVKKMKNGR